MMNFSDNYTQRRVALNKLGTVWNKNIYKKKKKYAIVTPISSQCVLFSGCINST